MKNKDLHQELINVAVNHYGDQLPPSSIEAIALKMKQDLESSIDCDLLVAVDYVKQLVAKTGIITVSKKKGPQAPSGHIGFVGEYQFHMGPTSSVFISVGAIDKTLINVELKLAPEHKFHYDLFRVISIDLKNPSTEKYINKILTSLTVLLKKRCEALTQAAAIVRHYTDKWRHNRI